jgi:tRNA U34 5-methylaminomethyl-2-thiouridine-forming methyltransferase MnmC
MLKSPADYDLIATEDGSWTLYSHHFQEACHSHSGAVHETIFHYLKGCQLDLILAQQKKIKILEVGFGAGIGWQETYKLMQNYPEHELQFYSLELDPRLVSWSEPMAQDQGDFYILKKDNCTLKVLIGDARKTIHHFSHELMGLDAIYQDAFSPKRNPSLWTTQWFSDLKHLSLPHTRLSTYSSSISIRKSLISAGWNIFEGQAFGKKRSSTRACLNQTTAPELLNKLSSHPTPALDDKDLL